MIYFDNAATSFPKPDGVKNAVIEAMTHYGANPGRSGHEMAAETAKQIYAVREKAAAFFGAGDEVERVVFTQNCTYALNMAIKGLARPGTHLLISDLEHNSVLRPVHALAVNGVVGYTVVQTTPQDARRTVEAFEREIRPNTKAIICTHASNAFGCKLPVRELGALAHKYGLYFVVDAAQSAGIEPIDVEEMQIDFLCAPGHKGLYGPAGTGLLIAKNAERLTPLAEGGTGSLSMEFRQPEFMPDRLESGTLNTSGIIGLGAGLDFVTLYGVEQLAAQELEVVSRVWDGFSSCKDLILYTERPTKETQVAVLSFNAKGLLAEEMASRLNQQGFAVRGGLQCAPLAHRKFGTQQGGTVRVSVGAFNTLEQADRLVRAAAQAVFDRNL